MVYIVPEDNYLAHYGIIRKSGRYPWGSGDDEVTRSRDFLDEIARLRKEGMTESEIAKSFHTDEHPFTTTDLRALNTIARNERRAADIAYAQRLKDKGMSNVAIAEQMDLAGESSVRALLDPTAKVRTDQLTALSESLKKEVEEHGFVDVGIGVERYTGSSRTQFDTGLAMLKSEGYHVVNVQIDQVGTGAGNKTTRKILAPPSKDLDALDPQSDAYKQAHKDYYKELVKNPDAVHLLGVVKSENGKIIDADPPPLSIDSSRVGIAYSQKNAKGEEIGGGLADGVIYVRPGVNDTTLGGAQYAQVRIAVDGTHYLKGMAVYKNDLPDGVDLLFNTNKTDTGNKFDAMKELKRDKVTGKVIEDDPFGAVTKPLLNDDGTRKSVMNIVNTEGDWNKWSKNLASQMLSKQKPTLIKEQLDKTYADKKKELDEILALTNPVVKKQLLESFADGVDSASVHLKAAHMPRQATQVIMPVAKLKETEVYAPNFRDGERVALVRYPHGGVFEIPELVVNNRNPDAVELLGKAAKDAIGINPKVAERLSGADFDGDTVLVIPNNAGKIKSKPALEQLKGFDPKAQYPAYDGMPKMSPKKKQTEMGKVSNLITDMTIKGANDAEIARAVKHSMVVIDAEKHNLNYKQSYKDNGIAALKQKYQGGADKGASTLISRTTSEVRVDYRKKGYRVNKETGEKEYQYTGEGYTNAKGVWVPRRTTSVKGAETNDARTLSSGMVQDELYAAHSNRLKAMANESRRVMVNEPPLRYSPSAAKVYAPEVARLNAALNTALKNAPLERQAQLIANGIVRQKKDANPDMDRDEIKRENGKALTTARARLGAGKLQIDISDREWEAIQSGAITNTKLTAILKNSDLDKVKQLATPRVNTVMTDAKKAQAQSLMNSGRTASEVADILGIPVSTLTSSME